MTLDKTSDTLKAYTHFFSHSLDELLQGNDGSIQPPSLESRMLTLTNVAKLKIPALSKVLSKDHVSSIQEIPFMTKENYVLVHDLASRCNKGQLTSSLEIIHASSGSSINSKGPTFWGRNTQDELSISTQFEQIFHDSFESHKKTTLAINAFPMGSWVGGVLRLFVHDTCLKKDISLLKLRQTVIMGYPPFVKMVIDSPLTSQGLCKDFWKPYNLKFIFAGEVFSEEWRKLLAVRSAIQEPERSIASIYGTADAGVLAVESILSVKIRMFLAKNPSIAKELFGLDRLSSLMQYNPLTRYLEKRNDNQTLAITSIPWKSSNETCQDAANRMGMPLIRYGIEDDGGIIGFSAMIDFVARKGMDLSFMQSLFYRELPFVWVFGRKFWTVSLYGANVYVENIMVGLEQPEISSFITGKFVLQVKEDPDDLRLQIHVELVPCSLPSVSDAQVAAVVLDHLKRLNSEFSNYVPVEKQLPCIIFHNHGESPYFTPGIKHKYIQ